MSPIDLVQIWVHGDSLKPYLVAVVVPRIAVLQECDAQKRGRKRER